MSYISQSVKGVHRTNNKMMSKNDENVLFSLMEGKVEFFKSIGTGGTSLPSAPTKLKALKFGISDPDLKLSATATLKHIKASKHAGDVFALVGLFDADYVATTSAKKIKLIHQGA
ncbi:hypothetical protein [Sulfuricurvum sp.]|uniref:hypothetical protein n=1 Tax=Sulfuricurvum sp. TaxID=2025608 RepID=UPI002625674F|nr:hypothetical protein [Sulfuricurvum sp.]MDD4949645.1 hypothetical protein [Sulfuricurvum sp.]